MTFDTRPLAKPSWQTRTCFWWANYSAIGDTEPRRNTHIFPTTISETADLVVDLSSNRSNSLLGFNCHQISTSPFIPRRIKLLN